MSTNPTMSHDFLLKLNKPFRPGTIGWWQVLVGGTPMTVEGLPLMVAGSHVGEAKSEYHNYLRRWEGKTKKKTKTEPAK